MEIGLKTLDRLGDKKKLSHIWPRTKELLTIGNRCDWDEAPPSPRTRWFVT